SRALAGNRPRRRGLRYPGPFVPRGSASRAFPHRSRRVPESERVFVVPENARGWRIDRFLAECFPKHSRRSLMRVVKAGAVLVDGRRTRPGILLAGGERVSLPSLEAATEAT